MFLPFFNESISMKHLLSLCIAHFLLAAMLAVPAVYADDSLKSPVTATVYHVDPARGDDKADGSVEKPFKTIERALPLLHGKGGEIRLAPGSLINESVRVIRKSGLPESPIVIDGRDSVINLGTDITAGPWTPLEEGYRYEKEVPEHKTKYGTSVVFVNGWPLFHDAPNGKSRRAWHGGFVRYDEAGKLIVVFPKGLHPNNAVVVLTGKTDQHSGLLVNGSSHVLVKNLTAVFAGNDGFNFHGEGDHFRLENVTGLFCGDEGTSSHETYQVDIVDSEFAFCGSVDGGIVDVNDSETTYKNVRVHQNRGPAFKLVGKKHTVERCIGYGNFGGNTPKPSEKVTAIDCTDQGDVKEDQAMPVYSNQSIPASKNDIKESDRMTRFLFYRPGA